MDILIHMITQVKTPYKNDRQAPLLEIKFTTENEASVNVHFSMSSQMKIETKSFSSVTKENIPTHLPPGVVHKLRYVGQESEVMLIRNAKHMKPTNFDITTETDPAYVQLYHGGYSVIVQLHSCGSMNFLVSLPGAVKSVNISSRNIFNTTDLIHTIVLWLDMQSLLQDILSSITSPLKKILRVSGFSKTCSPFQFSFCVPVSSQDTNYVHLTHREEMRMTIPQKFTWLKASQICKLYDAHLPVFHSRKQLFNFIDLLKTDKNLVPTNFMYIGLTKPSQQVEANSILLHQNLWKCEFLFWLKDTFLFCRRILFGRHITKLHSKSGQI